MSRQFGRVASAAALAIGVAALAGAQPGSSPRIAPPGAASSGTMAPAREPGTRLEVSGVVVDDAGGRIAGASIYAYQTDAEGYYGVKPVSDSANPRLRLLLRSDAQGNWSFSTIRPGSYPGSRVPGHIHFEVVADGFVRRVFEIVFEGDPFVTSAMRSNPAFSVRPVMPGGRITERIVLIGELTRELTRGR